MNIKGILSLAVIVIFCTSCATPALWKATNPQEYVRINMEDISEKELKKKGLKYYKDETSEAYYVEKSALTKFKDYSLRILGTPVTITLDAMISIVVIGTLMTAKGKIEHLRKEQCEQDLYCDPSGFQTY